MIPFLTPMPHALAHRGNSLSFPENTRPAFQSALELGVDVIETDVHLTADGEVIIWHDDSLKNAAGEVRIIREMSAGEVKSLDAGAFFSPDGGASFPFRNRNIHPLLLEEALREFPRIRFNIDLKDDNPELALKTGEVLRAAGAEERVCIGSYHHKVLKLFRRTCPLCATSLSRREIIYTLILRHIGLTLPLIGKRKVMILQMPEFSGNFRLLTEGLTGWCKKKNLILQIWTVNDPLEMDRLFQMGVDGIFSDSAEELIAAARRAGY